MAKTRGVFALITDEKTLLLSERMDDKGWTLPGGRVEEGETDQVALTREVEEETGGCNIVSLGDFREPLPLMGDSSKPSDLAFWKPVLLNGKPHPSNEALDHPWVSREELEAATQYRAISGLGLAGRTGRMMLAALDFYEAHKNVPNLFS